MDSWLKLAVRGPADVYFTGHNSDYDIFMKSTKDRADLVKEERESVQAAFGKMAAAYMRDFIPGSEFCERSDDFQRALDVAVASCHAKGVNAETSSISFFRVKYRKPDPGDIIEQKQQAKYDFDT